MGTLNFSDMDALVVDDEKFSLKIVTQIMKQIGFSRVYEAKDGSHALNYLQDIQGSHIKVIIADFNMPQMTGLQLLKAIRVGTKKVARDIPLIMLTGNTDKPLVAAALGLDVDAFIAKPVSRNTLEDRLNRVLNSYRTIKEPADYQCINADIKISNAAEEKKDIQHTGSILRDVEDKGRSVLLSRVPKGATLAQPIRLSDGKILLNAGVKVTERLIDKLNDLNGLGENIESVWIE
jgi:YesN/AraC family two-component response regulator